jgi:hypothetical protein
MLMKMTWWTPRPVANSNGLYAGRPPPVGADHLRTVPTRLGPLQADAVKQVMKDDFGLCEKTVNRAKRELGIDSQRQRGSDGEWVWVLPASPDK